MVDACVNRWHADPASTLIDWGCGSGEGAQRFQERGFAVTGFDIAHNCLNPGIDIPLVVGCLWEAPAELISDYAFCTDVMEHIPEDYVEATLSLIAERTRLAGFIQVDTVVDLFGDRMNPPERLHLAVHDCFWWYDLLGKYWRTVKPIKGTYTRWGYFCGK